MKTKFTLITLALIGSSMISLNATAQDHGKERRSVQIVSNETELVQEEKGEAKFQWNYPTNDEDDFVVYPNPATIGFNIAPAQPTDQNIPYSVVNARGAVVASGVVNPGVQQQWVSLSSLSPGVYFVRLSGAEGPAVQRLVVQ